MQCSMHSFNTHMDTESSKESLTSFLFGGKRRKEAFKKFTLKDFNLVGFFTVSGALVLFCKETTAETKAAKF